MNEKKFNFSKKFRICKTGDYRKVFKEGKKTSTENLNIYYLPNQLEFSRLGISIGKATGNAAKRNQRKRWLREAFRTSSFIRKRCLDIVVRLHNNCNEIDFQKFKEELESAFEKET